MALDYKIEWFRDNGKPSNQGLYVHTAIDMPCYHDLVTKEDYPNDPNHCDFVTGLFGIQGIVEVSVKAYQVYVIKAEVFHWEDLVPAVLYYVANYLGQTSVNELPGSRMTVGGINDRRKL